MPKSIRNGSVLVFGAASMLLACSGGKNGAAPEETGGASDRTSRAGGSAADSSAASSSGGRTAAGATAGGGTPSGAGRNSAGTTGNGGISTGPAAGSGGAAPSGGATTSGGATSIGAGGTASGGVGGTSAGATGNGGTTSIPTYSLRVDAPQSGAMVHGVVTVGGLAPGFVNVEVWDGTHQQPPLAQTTPKTDGSFSTSVDTSALAGGSTTWTVHAWDSAPGQSFMHEASVDVPLTIDRASGAGGATGAGGASGSGGGGGAVTGGRNFLIGMFSAGSTIASYSSYLGYHPEVTYNSSYQDDHHKKCGQPISGLNDIDNYPVIISVFTYNADYVGTAQGKYDNCYEDLFSGLESKVNTIYGVRIDVEFYPQPPAADFKGSFNHIVAIAKKHFPARIRYIFNPNWESGLGAGYVPESADVVGPDAYNNPQWCQDKTSAQCAGDKFDPNHPGSIAYWTKIAQQLGKTMALPEWGDDYGDGVYIKAVADWAFDKVLVTQGKSNSVVYLGYWDSNYNEDGHLRGSAMTVFQQRFANIPYTGTYWGPLIPTTNFDNF